MSYSIDANILIYASNSGAAEHSGARSFIEGCAGNPDLLCLTWSTLLAYQRIATHPSIFRNPLHPEAAWRNVENLLALPRAVVIGETDAFAPAYREVTSGLNIRGNLVPDAHLASVLQQHGVKRLYTTDSDFRKFAFLDVVNPLDAR